MKLSNYIELLVPPEHMCHGSQQSGKSVDTQQQVIAALHRHGGAGRHVSRHAQYTVIRRRYNHR